FKTKAISIAQDSTEEITQHVREWLKKKSYLTRRLNEAFPELEVNFRKAQKKIKKEISNLKEEIDKNLNNK
ncbi:MAG: hypothetical protein Q4G02_00705, partial [bacterium]|nr:hypothetical protein [bacterium]